jgi:hypothetical protein
MHLRHSAALQRLLSAPGDRPPGYTLYGNGRTMSSIPAAAVKQLSAAGVRLVRVEQRRDAADIRLLSDAHAFGCQHRERARVVVVSGDAGAGGGLGGRVTGIH